MPTILPGDPLPPELDKLYQWLYDSPGAMGLEMLDGYLTALLCCPPAPAPADCLPVILGEQPAGAAMEQGAAMIERYWKEKAAALAKEEYVLLFTEGETGAPAGNDWAVGFEEGMGARPREWKALIDDPANGPLLLPILALAHEHHPDPALCSPPIPPAQRPMLVQAMAGAVGEIHRYFHPARA